VVCPHCGKKSMNNLKIKIVYVDTDELTYEIEKDGKIYFASEFKDEDGNFEARCLVDNNEIKYKVDDEIWKYLDKHK